MVAPISRRFTRAAPGALNVFAYATDDATALTFIKVSKPNVIMDVISSPQPAAGLNYVIRLLATGAIDTGRRFYSTGMDPASAGRIAYGPINIAAGDYFFDVAQTLGGVAAFSFEIKFLSTP